MTKIEATAEVFWTAFKGLPQPEQQEILRRFIRDQGMRHDLMDLAIIEERRDEPSRSLHEYIDSTH